MKKYAVIVAGGSGSRMNSSVPKQFLLLRGKPILYYTIQAFLDAFGDEVEIILVLPEMHIGIGQEIVDAFFDSKKIQLVPGGATRFHSVKNGLQMVNDEGIVMVHDGVRALVNPDLLKRCYAAALETGSAVPVISSQDSVRIITGQSNEAIDRSRVMLVQTPQTFHSKILIPAFNSIEHKEHFTDEATVVEAFGIKINLIDGERSNIKITTPMDLIVAEEMMKE